MVVFSNFKDEFDSVFMLDGFVIFRYYIVFFFFYILKVVEIFKNLVFNFNLNLFLR